MAPSKNAEFPKIVDFNQNFINKESIGTDFSYKHEIVWKNVFGFFMLHLLALYGLYLTLIGSIMWQTIVWGMFVNLLADQGVTVGAHRYFTHKSFKAKKPLHILLLLLQTLSGENSLFVWVRDHRLHHRYSDTDADPHNAKRGFFFSHIGWLLTKKHPYVTELGRRIDMSDLMADPYIMWQKKYYYYIYVLVALYLPISVPVYFFGETLSGAFLHCYVLRYVIQLNVTWLVNSAAHIYGTRPYDRNLQPVESWFVSLLTLGEGWHNYHHAFPWDYKAAELTERLNWSGLVIEFLAKIGQAYDLKTASPEMIERRIVKTGDGTHYKFGNEEAKSQVTAFGPLHPLNPTYTTTMDEPDAVLKVEGLPLFHEKDVLNFDNRNAARG